MSDVYEKLRMKLDELAKGFPATKSGAEIDFLQLWFTPEEAEIFMAMENGFQTPAEYASRTGNDPEVMAEKLETMAKKGLLFRTRENGEVKYHNLPVIHGIFEFHINEFDPKLMRKYVGKLSATGLTKSLGDTPVPFYRTVPVKADLVTGSKILPYDDAITLVKSKKSVAVADCVCRKSMELIGNPCKAAGNRMETCLCFDAWADYYVENGLGRAITIDDAIKLLERNEEEGLVTQVANSTNPEIMCSCCSCCCGFMYSLKAFEAECRDNNSNYICQYDEELCINCGICVERCPLGANKMNDDTMEFTVERCLGCGLCVSTCPQNARSLVSKPENELYQPPDTLFDAYYEMEKYRKENPSK